MKTAPRPSSRSQEAWLVNVSVNWSTGEIHAQEKFELRLGAKNISLAEKLPYKIETDRLGRSLTSPPPFFDDVRNVVTIIELLRVGV